MVTNSGGGYSRWNEFDLTRWRSDTTLDPWGSFLYIRDVRSDEIWAAAHQPVGGSLGTSLGALLRRPRRVSPPRVRASKPSWTSPLPPKTTSSCDA